MACEHCARKAYLFDFGCRSCLLRWLSGCYRPHAKAWLDRYRKMHGEPAMLQLIAEATEYERNQADHPRRAGEQGE
jgi:hypothetical protein